MISNLAIDSGRRQRTPSPGRNWLASIPLNWQEIKLVSAVPKSVTSNLMDSLDTLMAKYPKLWKMEIEAAVGIKATLTLKENATPVFCKARSIPYSMRKKVEAGG